MSRAVDRHGVSMLSVRCTAYLTAPKQAVVLQYRDKQWFSGEESECSKTLVFYKSRAAYNNMIGSTIGPECLLCRYRTMCALFSSVVRGLVLEENGGARASAKGRPRLV
jgi:hypothetical protein